jgi:hypothetical protein
MSHYESYTTNRSVQYKRTITEFEQDNEVRRRT